MVYLLGVVVVATRYGRGPSLLASILSVAAFDFFFVPPRLHASRSRTSQYLFTFVGDAGRRRSVISGLAARIAPAGRGGPPARAAHGGALRDEPRAREHAAAWTPAPGDRGASHQRRVPEPDRRAAARHRRRGLVPAGRRGAVHARTRTSSASAKWVFEHRQPAGTRHRRRCPARARSTCRSQALARHRRRARRAARRIAHALDSPISTTSSRPSPIRPRSPSSARSSPTRRSRRRCAPRPSGCAARCSARSRTICARRWPTITGAASTLLDERRGSTRRRAASCSSPCATNPIGSTGSSEPPRDDAPRVGALQLRREWHPLEEVIGAALSRLGTELGATGA